MPVTFELSQRSARASSLIGLGSSGSSWRSAMTCGGESSNSEAIAMKRRLERWMSSNISAHASRQESSGVSRSRPSHAHGTYLHKSLTTSKDLERWRA